MPYQNSPMYLPSQLMEVELKFLYTRLVRVLPPESAIELICYCMDMTLPSNLPFDPEDMRRILKKPKKSRVIVAALLYKGITQHRLINHLGFNKKTVRAEVVESAPEMTILPEMPPYVEAWERIRPAMLDLTHEVITIQEVREVEKAWHLL